MKRKVKVQVPVEKRDLFEIKKRSCVFSAIQDIIRIRTV